MTGPDPSILDEISLGLDVALDELRRCGLSGRCVDLLRSPEPSDRKRAAERRRELLRARWFAGGRHGVVQPRRVRGRRVGWQVGSLPRRRARQHLTRYFEPLLDADAYTAFLTELALGRVEFNLRLDPIARLDRVEVEDVTRNALQQILLEEDGLAIDEARRHLARGGPGSGLVAQPGGRPEAEPSDRFIVELVPFVQHDLLWLYLILFALAPADGRRTMRPVIEEVVAHTYGLIALASVPVDILYHEVHGSAVVDTILPALEESAKLGREQSRDVLSVLGPLVGPSLSEIIEGLWARIDASRKKQADELTRTTTRVAAARSALTPRRFPSGPVAVSSPSGRRFDVSPDVVLSDWSRSQEIHWINDEIWPDLLGAVLLMNQAGVRPIVTAACNQWAGRHPPHQTHRSGIEIDFDWSYRDPGTRRHVVVPNLQRGRKVYTRPRDGAFYDPRRKKYFDLVYSGPGERTQRGMAALPTWVVFQALALTGFTRILYSDDANLNAALGDHLANAFPHLGIPQTWPLTGVDAAPRPTTRPRSTLEALVEPAVHFNHLHAEWQRAHSPGGITAFRVAETDLEQLVELAIRRDESPSFFGTFFALPDDPTQPDNDMVEAWLASSPPEAPALLPVWWEPLPDDESPTP